jgi:hypothetical protein
MTQEELAAMHQILCDYHRGLAKQAILGVVQQYHYDLAQRLADEAQQIPRRGMIKERLQKLERHYKPVT